MTNHRRLIVSPVGISVLSKSLDPSQGEERQQLIQHTNERELPDQTARFIDSLAQRAAERLRAGSVKQRRRLSAELNGLYALYEDRLSPNGDMHILVATDTALGRKAADILEAFLRQEIDVQSVNVFVPPGLNTACASSFSAGIKDLLNHFEQVIPRYANSGYEVIFNLTGSFKGLLGYLTIIGMFYADWIVYIFERSEELLTIPRLPLKIDEEGLAAHAVDLALLAAGAVYPRSQIRELPGALLEVDETGDATLSDWGHLIWNRIKADLLSRGLLPFPYLAYENSFEKEFRHAEKTLRIKLQEALAKASEILHSSQDDVAALKRDHGIRYDNYTGASLPDGTPIGHFRIDDGNRVTCVYRGGKLHLRHFGSHDDTERAEGVG